MTSAVCPGLADSQKVKRERLTRPAQWRRATSIFSYWTEGQFVVENYRTREVLSANPIIARVLHFFGQWRSLDEVCRELPEYNPQSIRRSVRQLVHSGLLLAKGSAQAEEDEKFFENWSSWLPARGDPSLRNQGHAVLEL